MKQKSPDGEETVRSQAFELSPDQTRDSVILVFFGCCLAIWPCRRRTQWVDEWSVHPAEEAANRLPRHGTLWGFNVLDNRALDTCNGKHLHRH